jgi:hypothetical protein
MAKVKKPKIEMTTKVGRPRFTIEDLYARNPDWEKKMMEIAQDGSSEVSARVLIGITPNEWESLIADSEEFRTTIIICRELCRHWWEETGRDLARGKIEGNSAVYIFNMKNRFGWRDKIEMSTDPDAPFQLETKQKTMTRDELIDACIERGIPLTMLEKVVENDS